MKCVCGHLDHMHTDRIYFRGGCSMCACEMFDVAISRPVIVNRRPVLDELDINEWPRARRL